MTDAMSNIDKLINETAGVNLDEQGDANGQNNTGDGGGDTGATTGGAQDGAQQPNNKGTNAAGDDAVGGQPVSNAGGKQSVPPAGNKTPQPPKGQQQQQPNTQGTQQPDGGAYRRLSEANQRLSAEARNLQTRYTALEAEVTALRNANSVGQQLGLAPDAQVQALQLMANYVKNPLATLKYMLTEAQAAGHDISTLLGQAGSINTDAVARLIDTKLKPLTDAKQQSEEHQRALAEADREVESFFASYPDAQVHMQAISNLIQRDQTLSLREARAELRTFCFENGYDWSQPLAPQIEARRNGGAQPSGGNAAGARQPGNAGVPLPNGRHTTGAPAARTNQGNATQQTKVFDEFSSNDIVKAAMRDAGIQI